MYKAAIIRMWTHSNSAHDNCGYAGDVASIA